MFYFLAPESVKLQSSGDLSYFYKHEEVCIIKSLIFIHDPMYLRQIPVLKTLNNLIIPVLKTLNNLIIPALKTLNNLMIPALKH